MFGRVRGRVPAALCVGAMALGAAAGCGGDDDSNARESEPEPLAAKEPLESFVKRTANLLATTTKKAECLDIDKISVRSITSFGCPAPKELRKSMGRFEVVGAEEHGTGAVVDYKSGAVKDGAAIVLFMARSHNWAISRFGIATKPSTGTSDEESRAGYNKALDEFLTAVRERDCDSYVAVTFNGDEKKDVVCKQAFPTTKPLAARLKRNPNAKPIYQGGNQSYGFFSLETAKPEPENVTISIAKATAKGPRPYVVLDVANSPTKFQQDYERGLDDGGDQPETSESRKVEDDPNDTAN